MPAGHLRSQCLGLRRPRRQSRDQLRDRFIARCPLFKTRSPGPVYNIVPPNGEPARFGLNLAGNNIYLQANVAWDTDYHEGFTIDVPGLPLGVENLILKNRLVFNGRSGDGTFITTPSTCFDPEKAPHLHAYSTYLLASSIKEEATPGYTFPASAAPAIESPLPEGKKPIDCPGIPYKPTTGLNPNTKETDSPSGATTEVQVPHITGGGERDSSNTKEAQVALPVGLGLNPSAANGLVVCSDEQFHKGSKAKVACPAASKVGTVAIDTPPLPDGSLTGNVFVGQQLSRDPASGDEYRIFVDAESARYGISVRLVGRVSADPATGQLTTRFFRTAPGAVQLLRPQTRRRAEGHPDQPADLRAAHDQRDDDPVVGQPRREADRQIHPDLGARRRRLRENAGRAALRPDLLRA